MLRIATWFIGASATIALLPNVVAGVEPPAQRPYRAFNQAVSASLSVANPKIRLGDKLKVEFRLEVEGVSNLYNPFLDPTIPCPGRIVLLDVQLPEISITDCAELSGVTTSS